MTSPSYRLFVYGSLLSGFRHPAYQYISDYFHLIGPALVRGQLFDMGEFPAAIPVTADLFIKGELYELKNHDEFGWAIAQLDDYEGVHGEMGEIALYRRDLVTVFCNGDSSDAWVYWYNGDVSGHPAIPSGDVLEYRNSKNSQ